MNGHGPTGRNCSIDSRASMSATEGETLNGGAKTRQKGAPKFIQGLRDLKAESGKKVELCVKVIGKYTTLILLNMF